MLVVGGDFAVGLNEAGYKVYGLDLSESGIATAIDRKVGHFCVSSVYESLTTPFGVNTFDAAVCIEVIEHLYNPRQLLHQVSQSLRPGGLFIVTTPYWGYLKNIVMAVTNRTDLALTALWDGGHIKHFSCSTLTRLVTEQDFEFFGFEGCGEGIRAHTPFLWNGMLLCFRKK
jgi:2-polyprenyl-3-methyl-5-hydroxy-6-metoxy-1,4-benzoquinol methylase